MVQAAGLCWCATYPDGRRVLILESLALYPIAHDPTTHIAEDDVGVAQVQRPTIVEGDARGDPDQRHVHHVVDYWIEPPEVGSAHAINEGNRRAAILVE
jgi:hypothetical protein